MEIDYTYYYRRWHPNTTSHRRDMAAYYRRLMGPYLPPDRAARILDVGCGAGFALLAMKTAGYEAAEGIDSDPGQVRAAQELGLGVQHVPDTVAHLHARPKHFSLILALDVLEHIPVHTQLDFVHAISEALTPGGRFICTVPNANSALAMRWRYNDWTHQTSFTSDSLEFLLYNGGGFTNFKIDSAEFFERPRNWWAPFLSGARHWWAFRLVRAWRRLEAMAELGPDIGRQIPLSLNLLCVAGKT